MMAFAVLDGVGLVSQKILTLREGIIVSDEWKNWDFYWKSFKADHLAEMLMRLW